MDANDVAGLEGKVVAHDVAGLDGVMVTHDDGLDMFECMEAPLNVPLQDGWGLVAWARGRGAEAWGVRGATGKGGGFEETLDVATATGAG